MTEAADQQQTAYRVLARKYRPASFADLIGQEALVRTLSNAIASGRLAHAFILTGVRGVGKTTTARIIGRALNCVGPDGTGAPTIAPCGACEHCTAIAEDRHVDVIEMDAASRTGIDDIRELIESVRYRPVSARYKVYIIDEVHMLSRQAFNGLLKTLEEPPEHVIFVFATTEIRKVPVTVLSRCQRFDLRRVAQAELARHFAAIAEKEGVEASETALAMIARAADGSVRDGLSLLDQAIALSAAGDPHESGGTAGGAAGDAVGGQVDEAQVKTMLGLADRARVVDLFEAVIAGRAGDALEILADLYNVGADPTVVLQDLLEFSHFVTRVKLVPATAESPGLPETERVRGQALAERLSMPVLARCWQMLLKGLGEARGAPVPLQAAEMVLIRLAYASELPTPGDLVKRLSGEARSSVPSNTAPPAEAPPPGALPSEAPPAPPPGPPGDQGPQAALAPQFAPEPAPHPATEQAPRPEASAAALPQPSSFAEVVALVREHREAIIANHLAEDVHLVQFETGRIEFRQGEGAPRDLAGRLGRLLQEWTGARWMVSVSSEPGAPTLRAQQDEAEAVLRQAALEDPLVKAVLETFPGARMVARRDARDHRDDDPSAPGEQPGEQEEDENP